MPLYEYRCHRCGKTFELRQKFAEAPLTVHEGCGGDVERIIFASALQFKGSGFYINDYGRGGKSRPTNGSNAKSESKTESKSESKPESKPESKSESKPETKGQNQPSTPTSSPEK
jgi:putative FmdB family regulatory protein